MFNDASHGDWYIADIQTPPPCNVPVLAGRFADPWPAGWKFLGCGPIGVSTERSPYKCLWPSSSIRTRTHVIRGLFLSDADLVKMDGPFAVGWESSDHRTRLFAHTDVRRYWRVGEFTVDTYWIHVAGAVARYCGLEMPAPADTFNGMVYRGWRKWIPTDEGLESPVFNSRWTPGWNHALSGKGFYACDSIDTLMPQDGACSDYRRGSVVVGSVLAAGRAVRGTKGIRAQYVRPESFVLTGNVDHDTRLLGLAERFGMSVVSYEQAEQMPSGLIKYDGEPPEGYGE